jgi:hypothetical protein
MEILTLLFYIEAKKVRTIGALSLKSLVKNIFALFIERYVFQIVPIVNAPPKGVHGKRYVVFYYSFFPPKSGEGANMPKYVVHASTKGSSKPLLSGYYLSLFFAKKIKKHIEKIYPGLEVRIEHFYPRGEYGQDHHDSTSRLTSRV